MIQDLFGDVVTRPQIAASAMPKNILNTAHGFDDFWKAWPVNPRKVGKQDCLNRWAKNGCAAIASHIIAHVEYLKTSEDWREGRIPMPATYLNQQRWDGWEPEPIRPKKPDALEQIKAHKGAPMPDNIREKINQLRGKK